MMLFIIAVVAVSIVAGALGYFAGYLHALHEVEVKSDRYLEQLRECQRQLSNASEHARRKPLTRL